MNNAITIEDFEGARNYLEELVVQTLAKMEIGIYDPWIKYIFEKDMKDMILSEYRMKYKDIPISFSFSVYLSSQTIEYSVQHFYHPFSSHLFLGSIMDSSRKKETSKPFFVDCYYSSLYEIFDEPRILVRYGHGKKDMEEGAISAAQEFYQGLDSMLARAYRLALEAGYVRG